MASRIDHRTVKGIENKWCSECKKYHPLDCFHKAGNHYWDGLFYICRECFNQKRKSNPRINALNVWRQMTDRVAKDGNYLKRETKVLIEKDDFINWYETNWFPHCVLDRKNNLGDYELSNIQLITHAEHNKKLRDDLLLSLGGKDTEETRFCRSCKTNKSFEDFGKKKKSISQFNKEGFDSICRECARIKRMEFYYRNKGGTNHARYQTSRS